MQRIRKRIITDETQRRVAVQIEYTDWLRIERSLHLQDEETKITDLARYNGVISLTEEPLAYQARMRNEWSLKCARSGLRAPGAQECLN